MCLSIIRGVLEKYLIVMILKKRTGFQSNLQNDYKKTAIKAALDNTHDSDFNLNF